MLDPNEGINCGVGRLELEISKEAFVKPFATGKPMEAAAIAREAIKPILLFIGQHRPVYTPLIQQGYTIAVAHPSGW